MPRSWIEITAFPSLTDIRIVIGVPGSLYLQALSIKLSSNWPRSGAWTSTQQPLGAIDSK